MPCTKTTITWRVGALHVTSFQLTYIIFAHLTVCAYSVHSRAFRRSHVCQVIFLQYTNTHLAPISYTRNQKKVIEHMLSYTNHTRIVRWNYYLKYIHILWNFYWFKHGGEIQWKISGMRANVIYHRICSFSVWIRNQRQLFPFVPTAMTRGLLRIGMGTQYVLVRRCIIDTTPSVHVVIMSFLMCIFNAVNDRMTDDIWYWSLHPISRPRLVSHADKTPKKGQFLSQCRYNFVATTNDYEAPKLKPKYRISPVGFVPNWKPYCRHRNGVFFWHTYIPLASVSGWHVRN